MSKQFICIFTATIFVTLSTIPTQAATVIESDELAICIADLIKKSASSEEIKLRLEKADSLRVESATELLSNQENGSFTTSSLIDLLVPFSQQDASEVMAFHSTPLINYENYDWGKGLIHNDTLSRLTRLYMEHSENDLDYTVMTEFEKYLDEIIPPFQIEAHYDQINQTFVKMMLAANGIAEPWVLHLLSNPNKESINHWSLIEQATQMYEGDVLTALGIIGFVFDTERISVRSRSRRLYLGSRVVPLLVDDRTDVLGDNYHFWMYLNAALQGKGSQAKKMSLTYEGAKGDFRDMEADSKGIEVGNLVRKILLGKDQNLECRL